MLFVQLLEDLSKRGESGEERDKERERETQGVSTFHSSLSKVTGGAGGWKVREQMKKFFRCSADKETQVSRTLLTA